MSAVNDWTGPASTDPQVWFRTTLYSIGDAVITTDARGLVREMNPPAERLTGWSEAEARGRPCPEVFRIISESTRLPVESPVTRVLRDGAVVGLANHTLLVARDGTERPIADSGAPIRDDAGTIIGTVLVFRDQTAEREAEQALRSSQARLLEAQRIARLGSWEIDLVGRRHHWSEEMYRIFGGTPESFRQSVWSFLDVVHPDDRARVEATFAASVRDRTPYDLVHRLHLGKETRYVHSRGETIYDFDGQPLRTVGTLVDVTEQVRAAEQLRHQASLVDSVSDAVISTDLEYRIVSWNRAAERIYGWTAEEVIGKTLRGIIPTVYVTGSRADAIRELDAAGTWRGELLMTRRDGTTRSVFASLSRTVDSHGRPTGTVSVNHDITDRKHLEAALAQSQKMESVGRLAGGVAHDFNNALQAILNLAELALDRIGPDHPGAADLRGIETTARRSADLARQLLAFARQQTAQPRVIDLNESASGIRRMLARLIGENITIDWPPAPDLWQVRIDPSQVDQILTNLTVNSRDAIRGVGTVRIRMANRLIDEESASRHPGIRPGDYVELTVEDDGVGMDAATVERAFDPFFTTKDIGKGTGLGLAVVYGIVKQYQGVIEVESTPGQGTLLRILLPAWRGGPAEEPASTVTLRATRGHETILVVEDEEQILSLARRALEREGYRVISHGNPLAALAAIATGDDPVDLLITDVVMPGLTGRDLAHRVQAIRPGTPCLFMSGYPADVIADHGVVEEGIELLQKPFTVRELAEKVREILDR